MSITTLYLFVFQRSHVNESNIILSLFALLYSLRRVKNISDKSHDGLTRRIPFTSGFQVCIPTCPGIRSSHPRSLNVR